MSNYRMGRDTTEHYTSFSECAKAWGRRPVIKRTKDEKKLKEQRSMFLKKHLCDSCGEPMTYIGGNQMVCKNENCKGIPHERIDSEGNVTVYYTTSYELLSDIGAIIANNIFA